MSLWKSCVPIHLPFLLVFFFIMCISNNKAFLNEYNFIGPPLKGTNHLFVWQTSSVKHFGIDPRCML